MKKIKLFEFIFIGYFVILCLHFMLHRYITIYPSLVFPAFSDAPKIVDEVKFADVSLYAIGGLLKHIKSITAITNPTVNSYKRLVPGYEAPVNSAEMAQYIGDFALHAHKYFNGKVLPVSVSTP